MLDQLETRFVSVARGSAIRSLPGNKLGGAAIVFDSPSEDLGGFREIIKPSALNDTLASRSDIRALVFHDPDKLMGRTSSGTLRLNPASHGLEFENDIPDVSYARDLLALVRRGDVRGMSFGFKVPKGGDSWGKGSDGRAVRTVHKLDLGEISYVANPAYTATRVESRSIRVDPEAIRTANAILRNPDYRPDFDRRRRELEIYRLLAA